MESTGEHVLKISYFRIVGPDQPSVKERGRCLGSSSTQQCWDAVVTAITDEEFVSKLCLYRDTFSYICRRLFPLPRKRNTNQCLCSPVDRHVAVAMGKLATNSEYRTASYLTGCGVGVVCHCLHDFCDAVIELLLSTHVESPDVRKLNELALFFQSR